MIDYNLILYIGLGLIIGGFCLFLYSEHRIRQLDMELARQKKLHQAFINGKVEEYKKCLQIVYGFIYSWEHLAFQPFTYSPDFKIC